MYHSINMILWTKYFIEAQGYIVDINNFFNKTRSPCSQKKKGSYPVPNEIRTSMTDKKRVAQIDLEIDYCPMERMQTDVLTKTLKSKVFRELQAQLLNYPVGCKDNGIIYDYVKDISVVSKTNSYMHNLCTNTQYQSYTESTRPRVRLPMD